MIVLENTVLSDDIAEVAFVCDLVKCKGACCSEGDYGAPLIEEEIGNIERNLDGVLPFLTQEGRQTIASKGIAVKDPDGDWSTTLIEGRECAFAVKDKKSSQWLCGIELAWKAGKSDWQKPISCHLYPIRVTRKEHYHLLNYHKWHICSPACDLGRKLQVPVYRFLEGPLTRAYGADWYQALCELIDHMKTSKN